MARRLNICWYTVVTRDVQVDGTQLLQKFIKKDIGERRWHELQINNCLNEKK